MNVPQIQVLNRLAGPNLWLSGRGLRFRLRDPALAAIELPPAGMETLARFRTSRKELAGVGDALSAPGPEALLIAALQALHLFIYQQPTEVRVAAVDAETVEVCVACLDLPVAEAMAALAAWLLAACFRYAGTAAAAMLDDALEGHFSRFLDSVGHCRLDASTRALLSAAEGLGIPWLRLSGAMPFFQYGYGSNSQLMLGAETNRSGYIGRQLTHSKTSTNQFLRGFSLPVPRQWQVRQEGQLAALAEEAGFPLVVKPANMDKGVGVHTGIRNGDELVAAWRAARQYSPQVLVEQHLAGDSHRLLVLEGELVAATRCLPAQVLGDGRASMRELVMALNRDPRRGLGDEKLLVRVIIDKALERFLARQGYALESIPAAGAVVLLASMANISAGGTAEDVTDRIHPDNRSIAERAARLARLGITGIDFLSPDIARSWRDTGGGIVEMNVLPGLRPHLISPPRQPVPESILRSQFSRRSWGRIPVVGITGSSGKTTTAVMLARILRRAGHRVGIANTLGVWVDDERVVDGDWAGPTGAFQLLKDPSVTAAVLETSRGGLLRHGLAVPVLTVGAVLNVRGDHVGIDGIDTVEQLARVKRLVAEHAGDAVVLNADDAHCVAMADHCRARRVVWAGRGARPEWLQPDQVYLRFDTDRGVLTCGTASATSWQYALADMPAWFRARAQHNGENAMYAAAIAVALDIDADVIRAALSGFDTSFENLPGRLNLFNGFSFPVVLDFAHNADKLSALAAFARQTAVSGRRVLVLTVSARRSDAEIKDIAGSVAGTFDRYVCTRKSRLHERAEWEVQQFAKDGLVAAGVNPEDIQLAKSEAEAIDLALSLARPEDMVYVTCGGVLDAWHQLHERARSRAG